MREEHLRGDPPAKGEHLRPQPDEQPLPRGGAGLELVHAARPRGEPEGLDAQGDGPGRHQRDAATGRLGEVDDLVGERLEGAQHPDRNAQFEHINAAVCEFQAAGEPAISVDTKKKELVGDFRNGGRELRPKGQPEPVRVHDFVIPELGKAVPYGVYDIAANAGWVNVGISHDTAVFAVESIRRWWQELGVLRYPTATRLLITADCGGSNGVRLRLWKREVQSLADELGLAITVSHLPPGTSKWNRIEHRPFAFITQNWRGKPLVSHQVIVQLIANTSTTTGLTVACRLDRNTYEKGVTVSNAEMAALNIHPHDFHGEWNYTFQPRIPNH